MNLLKKVLERRGKVLEFYIELTVTTEQNCARWRFVHNSFELVELPNQLVLSNTSQLYN